MNSSDTTIAPADLAPVLSRVLLAAYLITGDIEHAEQAVLKAIEGWHPGEESEERLVLHAIEAAARTNMTREPQPSEPDPRMADELKAVLNLGKQLRTCFVLRQLVGLPSRDCARLTGLIPAEFDECNITALQGLCTNKSGRHSARNG